MSILQNAIDSIAIGLEDFSSSDDRRLISCTRNVYAGLLLLFKHKLTTLDSPDSNEALLKQSVQPTINSNGKVQWKGRGLKTVDLQSIQDRFRSLDIDLDWKRMEHIRSFRNEIEHYFTTRNRQAIRSLLSDCFLIMNDFIRSHLSTDPKVLLGETSWSQLLQVNQVYKAEKEACDAGLATLTYFHDIILKALTEYTCDACGSDLIAPSDTDGDAETKCFICKSCDESLPYDAIVKRAISEYFRYEVYLSHTDGNEIPLADCPECDGVYLYGERVCSGCGTSVEQYCQRCSAPIPPEELAFSPFCGYCAHVISRED